MSVITTTEQGIIAANAGEILRVGAAFPNALAIATGLGGGPIAVAGRDEIGGLT